MKEDKWKVVYVSSRQEKKVYSLMERDGIQAYLPTYKKLQQWSDRKKWVEFPLFNGYLFVKPTALQREQALSYHGVVCYVRYNGEDAVIKNDEIETIKRLVTSGYSVESFNISDDFLIGESVKIIDGPLKGQLVEILRKGKENTYLVSFQTLGQGIKITLPNQIMVKL